MKKQTVAFVFVLLATGCPATQTHSTVKPQSVLKKYAAAVKAGDYDAAYNMMSLEFRKRYDRKDFLRMVKENPQEVNQSLKQLTGKPREVKVAAQVDYGDGDKMKLVVENGSWKIAVDPIDFYSQRTPAEALRSFVRAIERRRYEIVLRFVPDKWAKTMTIEKLRKQWEGDKEKEVVRLVKTLKANLNAPIRQVGNRATMPYGEKFEVRFVKEDGLWKIEDPD